jgi:thiamine-phosphate pyrophosphorylase
VAAVQLRLKGVGDADVRRAVDRLRPVAQDRGVAFLLNDDPRLAAETGCDGVHVGQEDMPCAETREIVGKDAIIGVTCHDSRHLAIEAVEDGADYVAFGAFYPTTTKIAKGRPEPEILSWWSQLTGVPCVAIGGITPANLAPLVSAGADFIAACSGIWRHKDGPAAAVREYTAAIAEAEETA